MDWEARLNDISYSNIYNLMNESNGDRNTSLRWLIILINRIEKAMIEYSLHNSFGISVKIGNFSPLDPMTSHIDNANSSEDIVTRCKDSLHQWIRDNNEYPGKAVRAQGRIYGEVGSPVTKEHCNEKDIAANFIVEINNELDSSQNLGSFKIQFILEFHNNDGAIISDVLLSKKKYVICQVYIMLMIYSFTFVCADKFF